MVALSVIGILSACGSRAISTLAPSLHVPETPLPALASSIGSPAASPTSIIASPAASPTSSGQDGGLLSHRFDALRVSTLAAILADQTANSLALVAKETAATYANFASSLLGLPTASAIRNDVIALAQASEKLSSLWQQVSQLTTYASLLSLITTIASDKGQWLTDIQAVERDLGLPVTS
jgi:hypothetical protein